MMVCDRCKKELSLKERDDADKIMTIYSAQGAYTNRHVDLCPNCKRLFLDYKEKMESYFMVNIDPIAIFKDKNYWDDSRR